MRATWPHVSAGALLVAVLVTACADRLAPPPAADVARGGEEAFLSGVHPRELTREGPLRWTGPRTRAVFERLPPGPATVEVQVRALMAPVTVAVNGAVVATLRGGQRRATTELLDSRGRIEVVLLSDAPERGGRRLGASLERVAVLRHARGLGPRPGLVFLFALPALAAALGWLTAGGGAVGALLAAFVVSIVQGAALWPQGLLRSAYAPNLSALLLAGCAGATLLARWSEHRWPGSGRWGFAAVLTALVLQGVVGTTPLMVVSDAVFHGNKLRAVAGGDLFPLSVTQHAAPFRFPYGVSFYALLAPLHLLGVDAVGLVRAGAALAAVTASAALFVLLCSASPARAALSVVMLNLLPRTLEVHSYGNLSNIFAQSLTVVFFAWWAGRLRGGVAAGAALLCMAALAHLSGLVVLVVLCPALLLASWGRADVRRRLWILVVGLGLAGLYYAGFLGSLLEQLPRLAQGAGRSGGAGWSEALHGQLAWARIHWGWPAMVLAIVGLPRPGRGPLERDLTAFWSAGGVLLVLAVTTPVEVRYQYALTLPLAVAAARGAGWLWGRGGFLRLAVAAGVTAQALLASQALREALFVRYRS